MPFDSLTFFSFDTLQAAATRAHLTILDLQLLDQHKAAEINRHRPGLLYRYRGTVRLAFGVTIIASFIGTVALEAHGLGTAAFLLSAALCACLGLSLTKSLRGPAHWEERTVEPECPVIPPRIAMAAQRLRTQLPGVTFRLGELFQERVQLDPYLVATDGASQLLIGIWDSDKLILCA